MSIDTIYIDGEAFEFARAKTDVNGNPRWIVHWMSLENPSSRDALRKSHTLAERYELAVKRSKAIGGRKYRHKAYGGGIVFQSYALDELARAIVKARNDSDLPG